MARRIACTSPTGSPSLRLYAPLQCRPPNWCQWAAWRKHHMFGWMKIVRSVYTMDATWIKWTLTTFCHRILSTAGRVEWRCWHRTGNGGCRRTTADNSWASARTQTRHQTSSDGQKASWITSLNDPVKTEINNSMPKYIRFFPKSIKCCFAKFCFPF